MTKGLNTLKRKERPVKNLGERISGIFDMPSDVIIDTPKITIISDNNITIENYTNILECSDHCLKVKTKRRIVTVLGNKMVICLITDGYIMMEGIIESVRWE